MIREALKWWLFPGLNLHARLRYRVLPRYFLKPQPGQPSLVLDAGCGNGMLTYQSYLLGHRALGISIKQGEVQRNRKLFNRYLGIPEDRLAFRVHNLDEVESLGMRFDQIICSEVLEHIGRDVELCRAFWRILKPGGVLHLCCPNADHPDNANGKLDADERGGHVRHGYTPASYLALLEPIGFRLSELIGLGGPLREACNKQITKVQERWGLWPGLLLFAVSWPLSRLDPSTPPVPYSLYVRATKPSRVAEPSPDRPSETCARAKMPAK
jgi:SAM-dependent methyltransferase